MLQFTDQHGTQWDVFEVANSTFSVGRPDILPAAFRLGWLVFDNGTERRRLAPFPMEWAGYSSVGLQSLLDAAARVAPRPRVGETKQAPEAGA